jgi:hypothetical protein
LRWALAAMRFKACGGRRRTVDPPLAQPPVAVQKKCRWLVSRVLMLQI